MGRSVPGVTAPGSALALPGLATYTLIDTGLDGVRAVALNGHHEIDPFTTATGPRYRHPQVWSSCMRAPLTFSPRRSAGLLGLWSPRTGSFPCCGPQWLEYGAAKVRAW